MLLVLIKLLHGDLRLVWGSSVNKDSFYSLLMSNKFRIFTFYSSCTIVIAAFFVLIEWQDQFVDFFTELKQYSEQHNLLWLAPRRPTKCAGGVAPYCSCSTYCTHDGAWHPCSYYCYYWNMADLSLVSIDRWLVSSQFPTSHG